jgi:flagellar hook-associated protein 2
MSDDGTISAKDKDGNDITSIEITDGPTITINTDGTATTTSTDENAVTLTGTNDVSDLSELIQSFISDYNTLITSINTKYYEDYDNDYLPLTDDEEDEMTSDEIESWNEQAQTGLLEHDDLLQSLTYDMKDAMSTFMKSAGIDIESYGITAVDDYSTESGTYSVTSSDLEDALSDDDTFSKIKSLFTSGQSTTTKYSTTNSSTDGILSRLKVAFNTNVLSSSSPFVLKAGYDDDYPSVSTSNELYLLIEEQEDLVEKYLEQLNDKEDALYEKYTYLETQLSYLSSSSSIFGSSSSSS